MHRRSSSSREMERIPYSQMMSTNRSTVVRRTPTDKNHPSGSTVADGNTSVAATDYGVVIPLLAIPPMRPRSFSGWLRELFNIPIPPMEEPRTIPFGHHPRDWKPRGYPGNAVNNRRYTIYTFLPLAILHQFSSFFNLFYLFLAASQLIPVLKVGFLFTYFSPLLMVVFLSLLKDALDEWKRFCRDHKANMEVFDKLERGGTIAPVRSANICVGDLLVLHHNERVPADCVVLHTSEKSGTTFIRTDQLDGETDWKLRYPLTSTKSCTYAQLSQLRMNICCEQPHKDIQVFAGSLDNAQGRAEAITPENTVWSSCVVATGSIVVAVVYTGRETRCALNSTSPRTKTGLIDKELNIIAFLCFLLLLLMSFLLVAQQRFYGNWFTMLVRFLILLSAMIPISMRVNVDVARIWYSYGISHDDKIPGTVARNTDLPEELGRLSFLVCDKTGTLTKNKMEFRVMQVGPSTVLTDRDLDQMRYATQEYFRVPAVSSARSLESRRYPLQNTKQWARNVQRVGDLVSAMALCHNVSPVLEDGDLSGLAPASTPRPLEYQASSPDEMALVKFCSSIGVTLDYRDLTTMRFSVAGDPQPHEYTILKLFPFSSVRMCMGVILRERSSSGSDTVKFYLKGADMKMKTVLRQGDWLDECCQELSQMGLRTLVFASRLLSEEQLETFLVQYDAAATTIGDGRTEAIAAAMQLIESDMDFLGVTGVEDELQDDVVLCLETLSMCGIKVWMLTGDKSETAITIGRSTRLIPSHVHVECLYGDRPSHRHIFAEALAEKYQEGGSNPSQPWTLVANGSDFLIFLNESCFLPVACRAYSIIVARCSPMQKAAVVKAIRNYKQNIRVAAIGDGGNDVSMIQAANVGIGIEGVEGKQASMAADFSITKFSSCLRLIMWHGRNSYRRTCRLSQFVMHRGIVYSVVQAVFSVLFAGTTMSVFNGYLLMGYSTIFTMAPAFALVMDEDYSESDVHEYPFLYKELLKSRSMNTRTFLQWVWLSIFQGGVMMLVSLQLFKDEMFQIVTIAYTSLLITELVILGSTVHLRILWQERRKRFFLFMLAELMSLVIFFVAVLILPNTFDRVFFFSWGCWWRVAVICLASIGPIAILQLLGKYVIFNPKLYYR